MKLAEENLDEPHLDSEKALDLVVRFAGILVTVCS